MHTYTRMLTFCLSTELGTSSARGKLTPSTKPPAASWAPVSSGTSTPTGALGSAASSKLSLGAGRSGSPSGGLRPPSSTGGAFLGTNVRATSPAGQAGANKTAPWTRGGSSHSGTEGLSSTEANRLKSVFPTAAEAARAEKEAEERAAAAAAEAQARSEEVLKALESFRGGNLGQGHHWDDLDDDDPFDEVIDFGDGTQYKVSAQPIPSSQPGEAAEARQAAEKEAQAAMHEEIEANFTKNPVSKEERFKDVTHDRTLPSRAAPPPWGGNRGRASESAAEAEQKQLYDAKVAASPLRSQKERRTSGAAAPAGGIQLLQRDRAPSASAPAQTPAPQQPAAAAPSRSWGPLAQRQASLNKTANPGAPAPAPTAIKTASPVPVTTKSGIRKASVSSMEPPAKALSSRSSIPATSPQTPHSQASGTSGGPPRPPPWGGVKRSLDGQAQATPPPPPQQQDQPVQAEPVTAPEAEAEKPIDQKEEMISAVERARKRREEEERKRLEEKERAKAKAAALEAKLREQEEAKKRALEEKQEQQRREAQLARERAEAEAKVKAEAEAEQARKVAQEAKDNAADAKAASTSPSDAASWRRALPTPQQPSALNGEGQRVSRELPAKPAFTLLQRPQPAKAESSDVPPAVSEKQRQTSGSQRESKYQPLRPEPRIDDARAARREQRTERSGVPRVEISVPPKPQVAAPTPRVRWAPQLPPFTRTEVPFDSAPVWNKYTIQFVSSLKRVLLDAKESSALKAQVQRRGGLRSYPIYALSWDPPLQALSIRTLSRDDLLFPRQYFRGVVQSRVSVPRKRLPQGLKQINQPVYEAHAATGLGSGIPRTPSPILFDMAVDASIASAPIEAGASLAAHRVKVSLPKSSSNGSIAKVTPAIRLPRSSSIHNAQGDTLASSNARSPFQAAVEAVSAGKVLSPGDVRRAPGSQVHPTATTRADVQDIISDEVTEIARPAQASFENGSEGALGLSRNPQITALSQSTANVATMGSKLDSSTTGLRPPVSASAAGSAWYTF